MSACSHADSTRITVCMHIIDMGAPLYSVFHEADGEWQAVCEHGAHDKAADARVVCFGCFRERHPEFESISGLYRGGQATAIISESGRWWVQPIEDIGSVQ